MEVEELFDTADANVEGDSIFPSLIDHSLEGQPSTSDDDSNKPPSVSSKLMWNGDTNLSNMYKLRPKLCDVCLLTDDGQRCFAHRIVLASAVSYFNAMFAGGGGGSAVNNGSTSNSSTNVGTFVEQNQFEVYIGNVDGRSLNEIIKYCYLGMVDVNEDIVQSLMSAATMLNCHDIVTICSEFLKTKLQNNNALGIFAFADVIGCQELREYSLSFVLNNFVSISNTQVEEFLQLSIERLIEIISSDFLDTGEQGEPFVLSAVNTWVTVNTTERLQYLPQLIKHVRFPKFSQEALISIEHDFPTISNEPAVKDLLIEALKYHLCKNTCNLTTFDGKLTSTFSHLNLESFYGGHSTPQWYMQGISQVFDLTNSRFRERIPRIRQKCLIVVGGQAPKAIRQCEYYDFVANKWSEFVCDLPSRRCRSGIAVLNGLIYAIGGFNGQLRVRTVDVFDPKIRQWTQCASLEARRSTLGACVLDGMVYAVGGFDGTIGLQSAEVYNPITRSWRFIAPMSTRRSSVAVAALNGLLYAIGGYDGASRQCLSSVECYNPELDRWTFIADMSQRRSGAGVGILDGRLYAVGGHDGPAVRKSVECYDSVNNVWSQCADMIVARRNAGVVAIDGLLYVVGGDDGQSNLNSIEVYDPVRNSWKQLPMSMSIGRSYAGVAIVDKTWQ